MTVYDLETFNKVKFVSYCGCIYELSQIFCKSSPDRTEQNIEDV